MQSGQAPRAGCEIEGPLPWEPTLFVGTYDLTALGYVREEFFVAGTAQSFVHGESGLEPRDEASYTTRIVVHRPGDVAAFSGTTVVEWLNVSGGGDGAPDWMMMHRHLIRTGAAWIGVSAQRVGVHGGGVMQGAPSLQETDPERYGVLQHPGDAYSYDIFSQVGDGVRRVDGRMLGGATVDRLLAVGESQSAIYLVTYVNEIDPIARVFDGFIVHGRGPSGPGLGGDSGMSQQRDDETPTDLSDRVQARSSATPDPIVSPRVPVITVQSETDLMLLGGIAARCDDGPNTRLWEIAGAAHFDTYGLGASFVDDGNLPIEQFAELVAPTDVPLGVQADECVNSGPQQHYVLQAALAHLERWVSDGDAPPHAPLLETTGNEVGAEFVSDERGNTLGGVRTPWVDVPTATLLGMGGVGSGFTVLFGVTRPFDAAELATLYPGGRDDYLAKFRAAANTAHEAGFLLEEDLPEIVALAAASWPGDVAAGDVERNAFT